MCLGAKNSKGERKMLTFVFIAYLIVAVSAMAYADEGPEVVHLGMVAPHIIGVIRLLSPAQRHRFGAATYVV